MLPCRARSFGWVSAGTCLAIGALVAGGNPAGAVDWQILYRLSEDLRVSDNIDLCPDPEGAAFSSQTGGGLDIIARTPTGEWGITGDIGHLVYFGEGAPEDRSRTTVAARSDLLKTTRSTDFNLNAHFSMAPATGTVLLDPLLLEPELPDADLTDIGLELVDFDRIRFGAGGGFVHRWTRVDDLIVSARADRVEFTEDAAGTTPHTFAELSAIWTRRLTRRIDGRTRASAGYFRPEEDSEARSLIYSLAVGSNVRATRRLTVDANAGVAIIDTRESDTTVAGTASRDSDVSVGFIGDLSLTYTPRRDTSMTLALSQRVSPGSLGELRTAQAARGAVTYLVNERSSLNLIGAFTSSTATGNGGDSREAWVVSPSYTHALTRSWAVTLGYRWLKSDDAHSNTAFLTLSHNGTILP